MIPVYKPYLTPRCKFLAKDAIDSGWISSNQGVYLELANEFLKNYLKVKYVLLTNNGTSAVHLVAKCLKYKEETRRNLIVPNNVYVAAWNSFINEGFSIHPIDANQQTWNFDILNYDKSRNVEHWSTAILAVHNLGNPVNVPLLKRLYPGVPVVEDACEAFGGTYEGKQAGTESLCSALSFYGNKNITTGEGGAFITNDDLLYTKARLWWGQGQSPKKFIHEELGYNYRMTNIQAALLYGQLLDFDEIRQNKNAIFSLYKEVLGPNERISFQEVTLDTTHSNWMFGIKISGGNYDDAEKFMVDKGIEIRPMFYSIKTHPYLSEVRSKTDVADILSKECIILPSYPELTEDEIGFIGKAVYEYTKTL